MTEWTVELAVEIVTRPVAVSPETLKLAQKHDDLARSMGFGYRGAGLPYLRKFALGFLQGHAAAEEKHKQELAKYRAVVEAGARLSEFRRPGNDSLQDLSWGEAIGDWDKALSALSGKEQGGAEEAGG